MGESIGILTSDQYFGLRFMEYVQSSKHHYKIYLFTYEESLNEFLETSELDYLFIDQTEYDLEIHKNKIKKIYMLINDPETKSDVEYPEIFKYQAVEEILKVIDKKKTLSKVSSKITSLFTINPSIFSLTFGWSYALSSSVYRNILFIPLDFYPVNLFSTYEKETQGVSDIIYYLKDNPSENLEKWKGFIRTIGSVNYIPSINHGFDLLTFSEDDMRMWISSLEGLKEFDEIIFFTNVSTPAIDELLYLSHHVINLRGKGPYEKRKLDEWKRQSLLTGKVKLQENIEEIVLVEDEFFLERGCFSLQELYGTQLWNQAKEYVEEHK